MKRLNKVIFTLLFSALILLSPFSLANEPGSIVDSEWLSHHLDQQDVLLIDVRSDSDFNLLHIEKAVNVPYVYLFDEDFMMPSLQQLQQLFSEAGVDYDKTIIVMDNGEFIWAARLFWLLETLGHNNVKLLNVGFGDWSEGLLPVTNVAVLPEATNFVPTLDQSKLQSKLGTLVSIGQRRILDGREQPHYFGVKSTANRFGHIPTAEHYPCTQNYEVTDTGNRIRPLEELASVYADLPKDEEIILYCGGGAESALNFIVLQELGYKVSIYDGSWQEWGNDPVLPITNPSEVEP